MSTRACPESAPSPANHSRSAGGKEKIADLEHFYPTLLKYSIPVTFDDKSRRERDAILKEIQQLCIRNSSASASTTDRPPAALVNQHASSATAASTESSLSPSESAAAIPYCSKKYPNLSSLAKHMNINQVFTREDLERALLGELLLKCSTVDPETKRPIPPMATLRNGRPVMAVSVPVIKGFRVKKKSGGKYISSSTSTNESSATYEQAYRTLQRTRVVDHVVGQLTAGHLRLGAEWITRYWLSDKGRPSVRQGLVEGCRKCGYLVQRLDKDSGLPVDEEGKPDTRPHPQNTGTYFIDQMENLPLYISVEKTPSGIPTLTATMPAWMHEALRGDKPRRARLPEAQMRKSFPLSDAGFMKAMEWRDARIADYERETGKDARSQMEKIAAKLAQQPRGESGWFVPKKKRKKMRAGDGDEIAADASGSGEDEEEEPVVWRKTSQGRVSEAAKVQL